MPTIQFACSEKIKAAAISGIEYRRTYHDDSRTTRYNDKTVAINDGYGHIRVYFPDKTILEKFPNGKTLQTNPDGVSICRDARNNSVMYIPRHRFMVPLKLIS